MIKLETPSQEMLEGRWNQVRGHLQERWGDITDNELDQVAGQREQLIGLLQQKYDLEREDAVKQLDEFATTYSARMEDVQNRSLNASLPEIPRWQWQAGLAAVLSILSLGTALVLYLKAQRAST